ncbi:MAG TPA: hypothetical protein VM243_10160, partial [Phycisphaerae bacterium]|nr:hypothetical protein [Phycisphaerae bacterium]
MGEGNALTGAFDYIDCQPTWSEQKGWVPVPPWVEYGDLGVEWNPSRKEQYVQELIDQLPSYDSE